MNSVREKIAEEEKKALDKHEQKQEMKSNPRKKPSLLNFDNLSQQSSSQYNNANSGSHGGTPISNQQSNFSANQMQQMLSFRLEKLKYHNNYRVARGDTIE